MAFNQQRNFKEMVPEKSDINILLLGETGVGKSTFINSFVNYLQHTSLSNAKKSQLLCLIPLSFTIPDEDFVDRIIDFGSDANEDTEIGNSSTQGARSYVFPFEDRNIRLIDTPGIGDARGVNQDDINFENVLTYISQFQYLHAVCFLLKPNVSVINAYFKFCIVHLLSRLEKSAANNIIFIFTNSRSTFYRPGDTLPVLKRILGEIRDCPPHVEIPCSKRNMFCVDNEAFKFLVALKKNIQFGDREQKEFSISWETSYQTCRNILSYICGDMNNDPIIPHEVQNTISVNEARRNIINLSKPLADVSDLIQDNLTVLKRHEAAIQQENLSKTELAAKLYVPTVELEETILSQPVTVCSASKCSEIYTCGELNKVHYKQRCHNPCYLTNVPKELIGTPELMNCAAMSANRCKICGCDFSVHMHIYYDSKVVQSRQQDNSVKARLRTKEDELMAKMNIVSILNKTSKEYEYEKEEISRCMAKFAHFLKENSISVYNDAYLDYLDYLIEREKMLGFSKDQDRINHYMSLKKHYEHEKRILDDTMKSARRMDSSIRIVTPLEVVNLVKNLYKLKHTGKKISKLHSIQQKSVQKSVVCKEYRHPTIMTTTDCESSDDDDCDDLKIITSLMTEKSLEAMRLKLKDMKLKGGNEDKIDEKKQRIYDILSKFQKDFEEKLPLNNANTQQSENRPNQQRERQNQQGEPANQQRHHNNFGARPKQTYPSSNRQYDNPSNRQYNNPPNRPFDNRKRNNNPRQPQYSRYDQGPAQMQFNANPNYPTNFPHPMMNNPQFQPQQFNPFPNAMPMQYQNPGNFPPPNAFVTNPQIGLSYQNQFRHNNPNRRGNYNGPQNNAQRKPNNTKFKKRTTNVNHQRQSDNTSNLSSSESDNEQTTQRSEGNRNFNDMKSDMINEIMKVYNKEAGKSTSDKKGSVFMYYKNQ